MTIREEIISVVVALAVSFVVRFLVLCYQEKGRANYLEVTRKAFEVFVRQMLTILLLPLRVIFSRGVRKNILYTLIQGAERQHNECGKLKVRISEREIEELANVLMQMTTGRLFVKFAVRLNYVYFYNFGYMVSSAIQLVAQYLETPKNSTAGNSNQIENHFADRYNGSVYRECYPALNLPSL